MRTLLVQDDQSYLDLGEDVISISGSLDSNGIYLLQHRIRPVEAQEEPT